MRKFQARVETADHLDWIDVSVGRDLGGPVPAWRTLHIRSTDELYELKHAIEVYLWEHEKHEQNPASD